MAPIRSNRSVGLRAVAKVLGVGAVVCGLCGCNGSEVQRAAPSLPVAAEYRTSFEVTENPLTEGGRWRRSKNGWTSVRSAGGNAFGTNGPANAYDDSYALLSGFGADQQAQGVIERSAELARDITHEVQLLLRFSDGPGYARGYECLFAYFGGVQIVRWNGAMGDYTVLPISDGKERLDRELRSGDRIRASITGDRIEVYINDELMAKARDSKFASGQPGIGFFTRPGGNSAHFALSSYAASSTR
jgi:hypothetical protein